MSDYTGHTAAEVIELMEMLAKQYAVHSSDECLAIARKGAALLKDQQSQLERLRGAMQEFVDRCDRGEVRSRYTYAKFKALLDEEKAEHALATSGV